MHAHTCELGSLREVLVHARTPVNTVSEKCSCTCAHVHLEPKRSAHAQAHSGTQSPRGVLVHAHTCERGAREVLVHARALVNAEPERSMPVRGSPTGVLRRDGPRMYFCSRNRGSRPLSLSLASAGTAGWAPSHPASWARGGPAEARGPRGPRQFATVRTPCPSGWAPAGPPQRPREGAC